MSIVPHESTSISSLLALVPEQVPDIFHWRDDLEPILALQPGGGRRKRAIAKLALERGMAAVTVRKKFDAYRDQGLAGLIDRRKHVALQDGEARGMSEEDEQLVKLWCESYQRKNKTAIEALRRAWRQQRVSREQQQRGLSVPQTGTPLDPLSGHPVGWSPRNLERHAPDDVSIKAARRGLSAAKSAMPLVYTSRRELYVGQYYLFDDLWHDHEVVDLDQRKRGRPLEFHGLDLKSACKFVWGCRTRVEAEFKHEGLKASDFRFVLAAALTGTGYHPTRGTTLIVENATASIPGDVEKLLHDLTGGMIKVERGGMQGAAAHAGQYAGRAKGNFRFKAALESLGNLIHNELSYLPGQVGMDRQHCPEEMHEGGRLTDPQTGRALTRYGLQKHTDALLMAFAQLPPERAEFLQWDVCNIQQFRVICDEVYARINRRTEHDLEGWDLLCVPDRLGGMRKMNPHEVFTPGARALRPISTELTALLIGSEQGEERTVIGNMIEVNCGEISGDALRFDATGILPDRQKFLTVLNPFDPTRLFCFTAKGAKGGFAAVLPRINVPGRANVEAVHRECGAAAQREAKLLAPIRARHLAEARAKAARHVHNAEVLDGGATAAGRQAARVDRREASLGAALRESELSPEEPADLQSETAAPEEW